MNRERERETGGEIQREERASKPREFKVFKKKLLNSLWRHPVVRYQSNIHMTQSSLGFDILNALPLNKARHDR